MAELFEKTWIKGLELENRTFRSATWSGVSDSRGYITEKALEFYGKLGEGGIGLIVTGFQFVMPNSIAMPFQMGNYSDDQLQGLTSLVETIHSRGGKVAAQLVHTGSKANPELFFEKGETELLHLCKRWGFNRIDNIVWPLPLASDRETILRLRDIGMRITCIPQSPGRIVNGRRMIVSVRTVRRVIHRQILDTS